LIIDNKLENNIRQRPRDDSKNWLNSKKHVDLNFGNPKINPFCKTGLIWFNYKIDNFTKLTIKLRVGISEQIKRKTFSKKPDVGGIGKLLINYNIFQLKNKSLKREIEILKLV
jgi:hypothetical protein